MRTTCQNNHLVDCGQYKAEAEEDLFWTCLLVGACVFTANMTSYIPSIEWHFIKPTRMTYVQCTIKLIWLDVYWNLMSDKICISFYQFRCYQLLFKELRMNTPNRIQFDTWIVHHACWFYLMPRLC